MGSGTAPIVITREWLNEMLCAYVHYALIFFVTGTWRMCAMDIYDSEDWFVHFALCFIATQELGIRALTLGMETGRTHINRKSNLPVIFAVMIAWNFPLPFISGLTLVLICSIVGACCCTYPTLEALARDVAVAIDKILTD